MSKELNERTESFDKQVGSIFDSIDRRIDEFDQVNDERFDRINRSLHIARILMIVTLVVVVIGFGAVALTGYIGISHIQSGLNLLITRVIK